MDDPRTSHDAPAERAAEIPGSASGAAETPRSTAGSGPAPRGDEKTFFCDLCGAPMLNLHCKLMCRRCGYRRDCSDP